MKTIKLATFIIAVAFLSYATVSCKDSKKEQDHDEMHHDDQQQSHHEDATMHHNANDDDMVMPSSNSTMHAAHQNSDVQQIIAAYMAVKDALVADNREAASHAGTTLNSALNAFNASRFTAPQQKELKTVLSAAQQHATRLGSSEIERQRAQFKALSKNITDLLAITGTETTLYEQFCPMYENGSSWLSMSKEVKNPYYGSKMLKCGSVTKEIK